MGPVPPNGTAFRFGNGVEAIIRANIIYAHTVRIVKIMRRRLVLAEPQHPAERLAPEVVGDGAPILLQTVFGASFRESGAESGMPVQDRAARIEGKRLNTV